MRCIENTITLDHIFNSTSSGIIATDADGHIVYINRQAANIIGLREEDIINAHILDYLPMTGRLVIKCLETGNSQLGQHVSGMKIRLVVDVTAIQENGRISGTVSNFQKMQQFEHSAQKLESYKNLNKQLEAIFASSSDGIWVCDGKGKIININKASEKLNGVQAKNIIDKNIKEIVKKGFIDRSVTLEVLETKRQVSLLQHIKITQKLLLVTGTPVFDKDGNIFLVVVNERDMTQLNAIRHKLEQNRMVTEKFKDELAELRMLELKEQKIVAESEEMQQVLRLSFKIAKMKASNILILGESGTGKGLLAKFIHKSSERKKKPFIQINCAALPESLLEAELFGYEKGAFTGASALGKAGLFELAHKGTLFLDEIGDLPFSVQAKLLKYLDDHEIMRLGAVKSKKVDCIIIAATNRDLEIHAKRDKFRQDLFYRLNTFTIQIPPLRERQDDIFELVSYFIKKYNKEYRQKRLISAKAMEELRSFQFPGNVRELKNIIKMAVVTSEKDVLDESIINNLKRAADHSIKIDKVSKAAMSITEEVLAYEKQILKSASKHCKSTREMAKYLRISQPTVVRKMKKHGLSGSIRFNIASK
jgi:PAS domain S-box-containing protein